MRQSGESVYLDPIELDELYHYYGETGETDRLTELLNLAKRLFPDDPVTTVMEAEYALNMDMPQQALDLLDTVTSGDNPFHCILRSAALAKLNRKSEAMEMAEMALMDEQPEDYVAYDLGVGFMNADDFPTALHYFNRSLKQHPDDARTMSGMIFCYAQIRQLDKVLPLAEKVLEIDPFNYEAWIAKGNCLMEQQRYTDAIEALDYAAALMPDEPNSFVMKAQCYEKTDQIALALSNLREAADKTEGYQKSVIFQILAGLLKDQKRFDEAAEAIWDSVAAQPSDPHLLYQAGMSFIDIDKLTDAISVLEQAYQLAPDVPTLDALADLYNRLNRYQEAADLYEKMSKLEPTSRVFTLWGGTMMSLNQMKKAYDLFKKANEVEELWQTYVLMSVCDAEMEQYARMEEDFRYAYFLNPDAAPKMMETLLPNIYKQMDEMYFLDMLKKEREEYIREKQSRLCDKAQKSKVKPKKKKDN